MKKELLELFSEFRSWIKQNIPNYTDNDFNFQSFMYWLEF